MSNYQHMIDFHSRRAHECRQLSFTQKKAGDLDGYEASSIRAENHLLAVANLTAQMTGRKTLRGHHRYPYGVPLEND